MVVTADFEWHQATTSEAQLERAKAEGWRYDATMRTEGEALDLLYSLVIATKPETVVETGTYWGYGTQALERGLEANGKGHLWTVEVDDTFDYRPRERVTYVTADSEEWARDEAPNHIDLAFVDCGDPIKRVAVAEELWPKLTQDALMLVHDTVFFTNFGKELARRFGVPLHIRSLNGLGIWQKRLI